MKLEILKRADGVWLSFESNTGKNGLFHIQCLSAERKTIAEKAVDEWAAEVNLDMIAVPIDLLANLREKFSLIQGEIIRDGNPAISSPVKDFIKLLCTDAIEMLDNKSPFEKGGERGIL